MAFHAEIGGIWLLTVVSLKTRELAELVGGVVVSKAERAGQLYQNLSFDLSSVITFHYSSCVGRRRLGKHHLGFFFQYEDGQDYINIFSIFVYCWNRSVFEVKSDVEVFKIILSLHCYPLDEVFENWLLYFWIKPFYVILLFSYLNVVQKNFVIPKLFLYYK